ncbi:type II toxin-antitoxin system VapC family toxin [Nitrosomonas halophila]|uniref:PIN domain nuclease, a component of toxin-antitoxin system (PIN domain) n=1 Tax=Nitrosomonas halophila TaxID=44576 RepID=A0A1H3NQ64_9PROT|nr:type II toxin-antitoxin system VapC family toxin [Nitrosomonas halophila]SDY90309.1 PIN domain nuclease, a component of toxin-antitoxin system (PIN domain) [Nitrosomonas halophila]
MKRYLLDTHSLLWSMWQPEKLGAQALAVLENTNNPVFVSSISLWEISLKYSLGKLNLGCKPGDLLPVMDEMGFERMILSFEEAALFYKLPKIAHKDPFDRMLIGKRYQMIWF